MALTQESILSVLLAENGQVRKSELVSTFRQAVDCVDPAQKEQNRELFKTFVNNLAFVKEVEGIRYVVLKKAYRHLLENIQERNVGETESEKAPLTGEQQGPPEGTGSGEDAGPKVSTVDRDTSDGEKPVEALDLIQQALQRSNFTSVSVKRMLSFDVHKHRQNKAKPYALPLRTPPSVTTVEIHKLKTDEVSATLESGCQKKEAIDCVTSPQMRRPSKSVKAPEKIQVPSTVPLEQSEHEWLVKCAAGHWSQVYGLLLRDSQLAEKRDFMSGFTALHWAAKCGNGEILVKIVDLSKQGGVDVDINVKTHEGYTPLHIAALHDQQYIMVMLVKELGANVSIRDHSGKKAYHYLHKDTAESVREMLGGPRVQPTRDSSPPEREEPELFPDLTKGLQSISRLFQPNVPGHKKRHKQRPAVSSLSEGPGDDQQDASFRQRLMSEVFM